MSNEEHLEEAPVTEQAVRLPSDPDALFYYGSILKFRGNKTGAEAFQKMRREAKQPTDAMREIRLLRSVVADKT